MDWLKKAAEFRLGRGLVALIMLALLLAGCQVSSDEPTPSQLTGSWEGFFNGLPVRAIFAPDNTFHMAYSDGELTGQAPSLIETVEPIEVRDPLGLTVENLVFHQLTATALSGNIGTWPLILDATPAARHSAQQANVAGQWSLASARALSDVRVDAAGTLSGSDGERCNYSGTLQLLTSDWNIYQLDLTLAQKASALDCSASGDYSGYAMVLGSDMDKTKTLWFSTAEVGRDNYLSGEWHATNNVAPVAVVKSFPSTVTVVAGATPVELDGSGSSDANHDPLKYTWTSAPGNSPVALTNATSAIASFSASVSGAYTFTLTVSDGFAIASENVIVNIVIVTDRFTDNNGNGTVTDNTTGLVWLKDAYCVDFVDPVVAPALFYGLNLSEAKSRIDQLGDGKCSLSDKSVAGAWRLPTKDELTSLVDKSFLSPALSDSAGSAQWHEGDAFLNVKSGSSYGYWTDTVDPLSIFANYFIDFTNGDQHTASVGTDYFVWPVRNP